MEQIDRLSGRNPRTAGVALLIPDQADFKIKIITRDKEGYLIMRKEPIDQKHNDYSYNIYLHLITEPQNAKSRNHDRGGLVLRM